MLAARSSGGSRRSHHHPNGRENAVTSTRSLLAPALGLALAACSEFPASPTAPAEPIEVPDRIVLGGVPLTLEVFLARDFMPPAPPEGHPLTARCSIVSADGSPLPSELALYSASVLHEGVTWLSIPTVIGTPSPATMEAISTGGPLWGPGGTADVVVTVGLGGQHRALLGAREQPIVRTE